MRFAENTMLFGSDPTARIVLLSFRAKSRNLLL